MATVNEIRSDLWRDYAATDRDGGECRIDSGLASESLFLTDRYHDDGYLTDEQTDNLRELMIEAGRRAAREAMIELVATAVGTVPTGPLTRRLLAAQERGAA